MMPSSRLISVICLVLLVAGTMACTDTPSTSTNGDGDQCPSGEVFDEDLQECVDAPSNQNAGNSNSENQNGGVDISDCDADVPHPHCDRDELDPWGDEGGDGVPNQYDNCPHFHNPDQTDTSGDGIGDACDNCPYTANPDQASRLENPYWDPHPFNEDAEIRKGDACHVAGDNSPYADTVTDSSGDGVPDIMDNCPDVNNPPTDPQCVATNCPDDPHCDECLCECEDEYPCEGCEQPDSSGDGVGDMCDNCPNHYNPEQTASPGNPDWGDHPFGDGSITMGDTCAPEPNNIPICYGQSVEFDIIKPNVYISFDVSGSMSTQDPELDQPRIDEALDGLDFIADELADDIRFGLGTYPGVNTGGCTIEHQFDVDEYTTQELKDEWADYSDTGCTPMLKSMEDIRDNNRHSDPSDPQDDERAKAVLLITDGVPNCDPEPTWGGCGGSSDTAVNNVANVIGDLEADGIPTYVVGFFIADSSLDQFAQAGGTGSHYPATDAQAIASAMSDVADLLVSCDYQLDPGGSIDPEKVWFKADGDYLDTDDYTFDPATNVLSVEEAACNEMRGDDGEELEVEIEIGCQEECTPEEPDGLCDVYYETCGEDYDCLVCEPEVCDGTDNNCSGTVDDNCPECSIYQASCDSDADCCEPFVCGDGGTCERECYPAGTSCQEDGDCCGVCAKDSGADVGSCVIP